MLYRVLLVDDEELIIKSLKRYLKKNKELEIITVTNPLDAIEMMKKEKIHIVFLDIQMPEKNGLDVLKEMKQIDPLVQIIMMTAYSTLDRVIRALELGANDYILKPFKSLEYVEGVLNYTLDKLKRWKEIFRENVTQERGMH